MFKFRHLQGQAIYRTKQDQYRQENLDNPCCFFLLQTLCLWLHDTSSKNISSNAISLNGPFRRMTKCHLDEMYFLKTNLGLRLDGH